MSKMTMSEAGKLGFLKSQATQKAQKEQRIQEYLLNPKKCKFCEQVLEYNIRYNTFCNHSCSASFTNCGKTKNYVDRKYPVKKCHHCDKDTVNTKFCSVNCRNKFKTKVFIENWLNGLEDGIVSDGMSISNHIKKWLKRERGEKCEICNWSEVNPITKKIPLQVDHIDGNSINNRPENLKLLCPNCHSLTPNFGALNTGKGRICRRDRDRKIAASLV